MCECWDYVDLWRYMLFRDCFLCLCVLLRLKGNTQIAQTKHVLVSRDVRVRRMVSKQCWKHNKTLPTKGAPAWAEGFPNLFINVSFVLVYMNWFKISVWHALYCIVFGCHCSLGFDLLLVGPLLCFFVVPVCFAWLSHFPQVFVFAAAFVSPSSRSMCVPQYHHVPRWRSAGLAYKLQLACTSLV